MNNSAKPNVVEMVDSILSEAVRFGASDIHFEPTSTELRIKYRRPVFYDESLRLETTCSRVTAAKVEHSYRLLRQRDGLLLTEGSSVLACVGADGKVRRIPEFMYPEQP